MSCTDSREYLDKKYLLPVTFDLLRKPRIKGATFCTQSTGRTLAKSNKILNPQLLLRAIKWDGKWNATMLNN